MSRKKIKTRIRLEDRLKLYERLDEGFEAIRMKLIHRYLFRAFGAGIAIAGTLAAILVYYLF